MSFHHPHIKPQYQPPHSLSTHSADLPHHMGSIDLQITNMNTKKQLPQVLVQNKAPQQPVVAS